MFEPGVALGLDLNSISAADLRSSVGVGNSRTFTVLSIRSGGSLTSTAPALDFTNFGGFLPSEWELASFDSVNGLTVRFTPVPEPTAVLAVAALGLLAGRRLTASNRRPA